MQVRNIVIPAVLALFMAACGSTAERDSTAGQTTVGDSSTRDSSAQGAGDQDRGSAKPLPMSEEERQQQQKRQLMQSNTVYFEFDSSDLSSEAQNTVRAHAEFLINNPDMNVRLEGHADERGTREYNIGLGERRAQAVARVMLSRGVSSDQFEIISYGEERPAALGSNEEAWAKNRRVEIVYR